MSVIAQCNRFGVTVLLGTAALFSGISAAVAADLALVVGGNARSVVVTADEPSPVATYAAGELVAHVEKATGVRLEVIREADLRNGDSRVPIYVGATAAAKQAGLDPDALPGETYRIKAIGGSVFILGREDGRDLFTAKPMRWQDRFVRETRRGTLYGVVDFLERTLGVRWLWPGDLGTYVPRRTNLAVAADMDISGGPAFKSRHYRIQAITNARVPEVARQNAKSAAGRVGFTTEGLQRYDEALRRYLLIHQEGDTEPQPRVGHRFQGWWRKYGKEHPEWFTMNDAGVRGPAPGMTLPPIIGPGVVLVLGHLGAIERGEMDGPEALHAGADHREASPGGD
ncbi:MAG: hypothetical protein KBI47_06875 [Armatimonadetes bacterium]|nr:hypothetical protein [Armatimonadota bacterium]